MNSGRSHIVGTTTATATTTTTTTTTTTSTISTKPVDTVVVIGPSVLGEIVSTVAAPPSPQSSSSGTLTPSHFYSPASPSVLDLPTQLFTTNIPLDMRIVKEKPY
ncbi:unnamed protein product [Rotaria sordida]|uniref:Uncharacterized protein n=1 Tax=Rotaria sordida TaxID=392033 RepID=A0A814Z476_9BILA|nr:unnamed protein product [Rotaria sordida]CAF1520144.1 unnamed protein product [Rotaria sordida]